MHSELPQHHPNVAVLMDVVRVMLPIPFDVHGKIQGDTPEIMHPDPLLCLILDLPNQALISNDEEIIFIQNDCSDDYALILIMEHKQASINMRCHESNRDLQVVNIGVPNV